ncbi:hypothetical protein E1264_04820 [Actinomadura sp. KC216]|nr:hypothetical protein E1264_04820 [Actinomadura sp. KC216]
MIFTPDSHVPSGENRACGRRGDAPRWRPVSIQSTPALGVHGVTFGLGEAVPAQRAHPDAAALTSSRLWWDGRMLPALSTVLACAVSITACGTQGDSAADGVNAAASGSPTLPGALDALAQDGVKITSMTGWSHQKTPPAISAEFEVTNHESEPFTYTITFDALSTSGAVLENTKQTTPAVGPGQTVRRTVRLNGSSPDLRGDKGRVRIAKVRRVPTAEAPAETGPCPSSGMRLTTDAGNAAMGYA